MRTIVIACSVGALALFGGPTQAQETADLGRHLLVASEAKLAEGRALIAAGRVDAGLVALREVSRLLARHEALVRRLRDGADAPAVPRVVVRVPAPPTGDPVLTRNTSIAVGRGLAWLALHQSRDGSWSCNNFQQMCRKNVCDGGGAKAEYDVGVTALATLAFLGAGHQPGSGPHGDVLKRAQRYLQGIQTADGCIGPKVADGHYMYSHALATMALAELYGVTKAMTLRAPAQRAVDFLLRAQNPYLGWRYGIRPGDNDTSVTAWAVFALKSAQVAGLTVSSEGFAGAKQWFDKVTDDRFYKTGYTQKADNGARLPESARYRPAEAMTAAAVAARMLMGAKVRDPVIQGGARLLANQPPAWDPEQGNDFYYWYFGTLATYQVGGDAWTRWSRFLKGALLTPQRRGGDEHGSWDPLSAWGPAGGRVYATAINTLTLEIYYRAQKRK